MVLLNIMNRRGSDPYIWLSCILLFSAVSGQTNSYRSYDSRTPGRRQGWSKQSSLSPFQRPAVPDGYPSYKDTSTLYQDDSRPYKEPDSRSYKEPDSRPYKEPDSRPYQEPDSRPYQEPDSIAYNDDSGPYRGYSGEEFSAEYYKPVSYPYSDSDQSHYDGEEELNMTMVRIGGFAGSGDTRGFGAYDYPKPEHQDLQHSPGSHLMDPEIVELMRQSKKYHESGYHRNNPMLVHPLSPPL